MLINHPKTQEYLESKEGIDERGDNIAKMLEKTLKLCEKYREKVPVGDHIHYLGGLVGIFAQRTSELKLEQKDFISAVSKSAAMYLKSME